MTKDQYKISRRNKHEARKHFGILGKSNLVLHHTDASLRHENVERYIEWRPEDLVVMTNSEHNRLHAIGNTKTKGKRMIFTDEHKRKISEAQIGTKWYTDGKINLRLQADVIPPEGFYRGCSKNQMNKA